ncbi:uncharacterized protein LOC124131392 [Haliotis rufescens]|uniref:uncharacterized protein LOC124131392 n=1 Tax=Haliotis rufescens TaxID=6454 RepID=UPI00201EA579|nr:uncharacterized protein LOC124131392 [Haliotis rufescens]XP_046350609.2 uncharacterized protein LOC124131392 [Haliotis rufescens]XP_046350610.2 uncharacterized protein LOC124131392 [Haliotis rufescens]
MERLLKEREDSRKMTNTWDGTKTLVFREVEDTRTRTLKQSTEIVDITLSRHVLHQIGAKGKPEDHQELIRLTWDSVNDSSCNRSSYETVQRDQNLLEKIVQCLCENNFSTLRQLCCTFYNTYTTKLTCIKINPLTFTFLHQNGQGIEEMRNLGPELASVLKKQLSEILPETDDVKLNLQFCSDDTGSRKYRMQISGESGTERRFSQIEKQIESLRSMFEEWTVQQRTPVARTPSRTSAPVVSQHEERDSGNQNHVPGPAASSDRTSEKYEGAAEGKQNTQETIIATVTTAQTPPSVDQYRQVNRTFGITGNSSDVDNSEVNSDVKRVLHHVVDPNHVEDKPGVTQLPDFELSATGGYGETPGVLGMKNIKVVEDLPSATTTAGNLTTPQQCLTYDGRRAESSRQNRIKLNPAPPKAKGLDTILCLDASSSMGTDGFKEMKRIACSFIDGLDDITSQYEIEENVAVVSFGGTPRVEHHLSNDYGSIITAIENIVFGGRSPLFEALKECLQALSGRGGSFSISGVHRVQPRLIIITDGKASDDRAVGDDAETIDDNVKLHVIQMMQQFSASENMSTYPRPVVWIPAGNAKMSFIKSLASFAYAQLLSGSDIKQLCKYQRIQVTIGKIFVCMQNNIGSSGSGDETEAIMNAFAGDLDPEDKEEVLNTVRAKLEGKPGVGSEECGPVDFDNVIESENPVLPALGTRVVRGPDWKWDNQDTDGVGTVINHIHDPRKICWIWVHWDNGSCNKYRYGADGAFDVKSVECQPRMVYSDLLIGIGCEVQRGADWQDEYGDQDGGPGGVGVVVRVKDNGMVKVRWRLTHQINSYRYGYDGKMDLILRDPVDIVMAYSKDDTPGIASPGDQDFLTQTQWMWQWKDETGNWVSYSEENEKRLEHAYGKRSNGSCLLSINGLQYRVLFKEWHQRRLEDNVRMDVHRIPMDRQ